MKKQLLYFIASFLFLITIAEKGGASLPVMKNEVLNADSTNNQAVEALMTSLLQFKNLDHSSLTKNQRQSLRKEVRVINKAVLQERRGIYLSLSAVIIVLLLLIILL
jgi:hypothetical protein